jgi:catechol 2,3-dioxygenase-like lactoylglutathione lyase family enzyme
METYITGLQHIGIPTKDLSGSLKFYEGLGFKEFYRTVNDGVEVSYLELKGAVIEIYTSDAANPVTGAIDHITLDVTDIEAVYELAKENGYVIVDGGGINDLPFFNGIRYIMLEGVNKERIELTQKL